MHWACQLAGIIITPLNWRATADELDYCLTDADAVALVYEDAAAEAVAGSATAANIPRIRVGTAQPQEVCVRGPADGGTGCRAARQRR